MSGRWWFLARVGLAMIGIFVGAPLLILGQVPNRIAGSQAETVVGWPGVAQEEPCKWTAYVVCETDHRSAYLVVRANLADGYHIYSLTHPGDSATKLEVAKSDQFRIAGAFRPTESPRRQPGPQESEWQEEHVEMIEFFLPVALSPGIKPEELEIQVRINGQICNSDSCQLISNKVVVAQFARYLESNERIGTALNPAQSAQRNIVRNP